MADPFDIVTPTQRRIVMAAVVVYAVLFIVELTTGNRFAAAGADLLLAALVIPASVVVIQRARERATTDWVAVAAAGAFLVAGVTIAYEGLSALGVVPRILIIETLGTFALLVALGLYLYRRR